MRTIIPSSMITRKFIKAYSTNTATATTTATNKISTIMMNHNLINNHLGLASSTSPSSPPSPCVQNNNNNFNNNNNSRSNSITNNLIGGKINSTKSQHSSNTTLNAGTNFHHDTNGNDSIDIIRNKNSTCNAAIRITENPIPETVAC